MGKIIEITSREEFEKTISSEGIILVDFHAIWCSPCKLLGAELESVSEEVENVTVLKVNVDNNPELSSKYKVRNIPVVFVIKDGEQVDKFVGFQNKDKIIEIINRNTTEETKTDESED